MSYTNRNMGYATGYSLGSIVIDINSGEVEESPFTGYDIVHPTKKEDGSIDISGYSRDRPEMGERPYGPSTQETPDYSRIPREEVQENPDLGKEPTYEERIRDLEVNQRILERIEGGETLEDILKE